jgi:hypothetical protein
LLLTGARRVANVKFFTASKENLSHAQLAPLAFRREGIDL